jgi:tetratricopeptide (TPR) repeat protein
VRLTLPYALRLSQAVLYDLLGRREAQRRNLEALDRLAAGLGTAERAQVALQSSVYALHTCDYPVAIGAAGRAVALARDTFDRATEAQGLIHGATALIKQSHLPEAQAQLELALELARPLGDRSLEAQALRTLSIVCLDRGDLRRVTELIAGVTDIYRQSGDRQGLARAINISAIAAQDSSDHGTSIERYRSALTIFQQIGDRDGQAMVLHNLAYSHHFLGMYREAGERYRHSLAIKLEIGDRQGEANTRNGLGTVCLALGELPQAIEYLRQALVISREIGYREGEAEALAGMSQCLREQEDLDGAAVCADGACALWRDSGRAIFAIEASGHRLEIALVAQDSARAAQLCAAILAYLDSGGSLAGTLDPLRVRLACYRACRAAGDSRAGKLLTEAHRLLQEQALSIKDDDYRRAYLAIPCHREIAEECRARGLA